MQQHIRVGAGLTTLVRIEMDSVFSSLDRLRRQPAQSTEADDWKWVLRTSSATRPVLQLRDGGILLASGESTSGDRPRPAAQHPHRNDQRIAPPRLPFRAARVSRDRGFLRSAARQYRPSTGCWRE